MFWLKKLAFFYSIDVLSLSFTEFFKQYRIENILAPPGIKLRSACLTDKRSVTELQQPAGKQLVAAILEGPLFNRARLFNRTSYPDS